MAECGTLRAYNHDQCRCASCRETVRRYRADLRQPRPLPKRRDETWRTQAECRAWPGEWWLHDHEGKHTRIAGCVDCARARAICEGCPVVAECLEYALEVGEPWGTWGGASTEQRRQIRRNRRKATA